MFSQYYDIKIKEFEERIASIEKSRISCRKFSLFERIFNRKKMNDYMDKFYAKERVLNRRLSDAQGELDFFKRNVEGLKSIREIKKEQVEEIQELIKTGKIKYVLDKSDEFISDLYEGSASRQYREENPFKNLDDFILVHKTNFLPINDKICTPKSTKAKDPIEFEFRGKKYFANRFVANDTIHFAVNGPVADMPFDGSWENRKYAVLVSLEEVDKSNLVGVRSEDTYFDGDVSLGKKYYILVPKSEEKEESNIFNINPNPNATIVYYDGIPLDQAIDLLITYTGRKREDVGNHGWYNEHSELFANEILKEYNIPRALIHFDSEYMIKRCMENSANIVVAIFEELKSRGLEPTNEELSQIVKNFNVPASYGSDFIEMFDKYYLPMFRKYGYDIPEEILVDERLKEPLWRKNREPNCDIINEYIFECIRNGKKLNIDKSLNEKNGESL